MALILLLFGLMVLGKLASPSPDEQAVSVAKVDDGPHREVTAVHLAAEYERNEVAADLEYKGKRLMVTGVVQDIAKDFADDTVVTIETTNRFMPVRVHMRDGQEANVATITKGNPVVLRGVGGGLILGSPIVNDAVY